MIHSAHPQFYPITGVAKWRSNIALWCRSVSFLLDIYIRDVSLWYWYLCPVAATTSSATCHDFTVTTVTSDNHTPHTLPYSSFFLLHHLLHSSLVCIFSNSDTVCLCSLLRFFGLIWCIKGHSFVHFTSFLRLTSTVSSHTRNSAFFQTTQVYLGDTVPQEILVSC